MLPVNLIVKLYYYCKIHIQFLKLLWNVFKGGLPILSDGIFSLIIMVYVRFRYTSIKLKQNPKKTCRLGSNIVVVTDWSGINLEFQMANWSWNFHSFLFSVSFFLIFYLFCWKRGLKEVGIRFLKKPDAGSSVPILIQLRRFFWNITRFSGLDILNRQDSIQVPLNLGQIFVLPGQIICRFYSYFSGQDICFGQINAFCLDQMR